MDVSLPHARPYSGLTPVKRRFSELQLMIGGSVLLVVLYVFLHRNVQRKKASASIAATANTPQVPNPTLSSPLGQTATAISTN